MCSCPPSKPMASSPASNRGSGRYTPPNHLTEFYNSYTNEIEEDIGHNIKTMNTITLQKMYQYGQKIGGLNDKNWHAYI